MALWRRLRSAVTRTRAAVDAAARAGSEAFAEQLLRTPRYTDSRKLNHYELQMYSQNGEDGILLKDLVAMAQERLGDHELFPGGRLRNYVTYTKVDLEARCEVERVPRSSPQRVVRRRPG